MMELDGTGGEGERRDGSVVVKSGSSVQLVTGMRAGSAFGQPSQKGGQRSGWEGDRCLIGGGRWEEREVASG